MNNIARINRRDFFKKSAAIAIGFPYIVRSSASAKAGTVLASNRIAVGFIGVGDHGTAVNLRNFLSNADVRVAAVCDVDSRHRNRAKYIVDRKYENSDCAAYNDFREIIERNDIDAVVVSTPDHWHVPISIAAVKAGKDIYCEKPLSLTIAEGRALSDAVKQYGRVFQTGSEFRSHQNFHRAAELVRNGRVGKLQRIWTYMPGNPWANEPGNSEPTAIPEGFDYDMWLGPAPYAPYTKDRCHWNYRWILDYSGGQLTDWGGHLVDQGQWANDSEYSGPVAIAGEGQFRTEGLYNSARQFHIEYTYANGVKLICTDKDEESSRGIKYEGSKGWIYTKYMGPIKAYPASILDSVIGANETHLYTHAAGPERNFLDCVRSREKCYYPAEVGHRSVTICHLGNISMLLGRKLRWDPTKERCVNDAEANRMLSRPMRSPWHL